MIVVGPVIAIVCIGLFCIIMDFIYPSEEPEIVIHPPAPQKLSNNILEYQEDDYDISNDTYMMED